MEKFANFRPLKLLCAGVLTEWWDKSPEQRLSRNPSLKKKQQKQIEDVATRSLFSVLDELIQAPVVGPAKTSPATRARDILKRHTGFWIREAMDSLKRGKAPREVAKDLSEEVIKVIEDTDLPQLMNPVKREFKLSPEQRRQWLEGERGGYFNPSVQEKMDPSTFVIFEEWAKEIVEDLIVEPSMEETQELDVKEIEEALKQDVERAKKLQSERISMEKFAGISRNAVIRKCKKPDKETGKPWCLYTKDNTRLLGRHKTKEDAYKQESAIHANK